MNIKACSTSSADKSQKRPRREEHLRIFIVLERRCLEFSEAFKQLTEKQELLATLMESEKSLQKSSMS